MRVTVEIVPNGVEERARVIDTLYIGNVSMLSDVSDYEVYLSWDPRQQAKEDRVPDARVVGHRRSDGWGDLVLRSIIATRAGQQT